MLCGKSSDIGKIGNHANVMYNTYINKWIYFYRQGQNVMMRKSSDPLDFHGDNSADDIICKIPDGYRAAYFSINPDQGDMATCGKEFYLYYRYYKSGVYPTARVKISFE